MCNAYIDKQIAAEGLDQPEAIMLYEEWDGTKAKLLTDEAPAISGSSPRRNRPPDRLTAPPAELTSAERDPKRDGALFLVWESDRYGNGLARVLEGRFIDWRHLAQ